MRQDFAHKTDLIKIEGSLWNIRPVNADDAHALFDYLNRMALEPVDNTHFLDSLMAENVTELREEIVDLRQKSNTCIYVALAGEQIVGMIFCQNWDSDFNQHTVTISINIHPDYRGMGIGSNLLCAAILWAILQPDVKWVELKVLAHNTGAIKLYERFGFRCEESLLLRKQLGHEDSVLMSRYL